MFEEFDAEHAVVGAFLRGGGEVVGGDVAGDDLEVLEAGLLRDGVDVLFLGAGVGEGGDLAVGEDFGEVEGEGAPAAALELLVKCRLVVSSVSWGTTAESFPSAAFNSREGVKGRNQNIKPTQDQKSSSRPSVPPAQHITPT